MNFFGCNVGPCPGIQEERVIPETTRNMLPMDLSEEPAIMPQRRKKINGAVALGAVAAGITYIWG